jgi:superfamily II RNA helicase
MISPLLKLVPQFHEYKDANPSDLLLDRFLSFVSQKGLNLYPAQEEAILNLLANENVILNTPTGSGKSLVAEALVFMSFALGKRSVYTCPIKALVNEKFLNLCRLFGAENVGLITGDGSVNREAPIICCTAEILSNMALTEGDQAKVDDVIMDEFHYYSDRERGQAWQIPLLELSRARFLLMSATLGDMDFFAKALTKLTEKPTRIVIGYDRPVPLSFEYRAETHLHETILDLIQTGRSPIYLVNFTQNLAADEAQNLMSIDFLTKEQKKALLERLSGISFRSPYGKDLARYLKHGIGVHHAGLLPRYRILVEKLAQEGFLKVISGTDTLGVGVNIPIRTVLFTKLCKYDGEKTAILSNRDFHQISGRAGRKGFDDKGFVVAQAPEHSIENIKLDRKAAANPSKAKKIVKAKPPEKGFVLWTEETFKKLIASKPEALQSRFKIDHGLVLSVLSRSNSDACEALRSLIRNSHETDAIKKKHRARAFELFRSLVDRKLVTLNPLRVQTDLQQDFSLHQSLSLWLIDTLKLLNPESDTYALDVITLCEAIVESPDLILRKQTDRARQALFVQLKQESVEYEERQERLDAVEHPKPLRDFIYSSFNEWSERHPWVGGENIRPKSIVREMLESGYGFADYIREYELFRAEGGLLRTINEVFKVLSQTVPDSFKNEDLREIEVELALIIRSVDSSLLEEWDRLKSDFVELGGKDPKGSGRTDSERATATRIEKEYEAENEKERNKNREQFLRRHWRAEIFRFVRALGVSDSEEAANILQDWQIAGVEMCSLSVHVEEPTVGILDWTQSRLDEFIRCARDGGFKGFRTDLKAREARLSDFQFVNTEILVEQKILDLESDLVAFLKLQIKLEAK